MASFEIIHVHVLPIALGILFAGGLCITFLISVLRGDVSPYFPFISETGALFPEAGIFSIFLYITSLFGTVVMFIRFGVIKELNQQMSKTLDILNIISIAVGIISMCGMVVVAAYPMTSVVQAHVIGADVLFFGCNIYAILQTTLSYMMCPVYHGKRICHIRLVITILSLLSLLTMLATGPLAFSQWSQQSHDHWTGGKLPTDKGFRLLSVSAAAEWMMALFFLSYYFTFIREFQKVVFSVRISVPDNHLGNEEPYQNFSEEADERTSLMS